MVRFSLTAKLAASYLLVAALIVGPTLIFLRAAFLRTLEQVEGTVLEPRANALRDELERVPPGHLDELQSQVKRFANLLQLRITLIAPDGTPLVDSEHDDVRDMENHRDRPEVQAALKGHYGSDSRNSFTVHHELVYGAVPLPAQGPVRMVVRVARRVTSMREGAGSAIVTMRLSTAVGVTVALLLSLGAAIYVATPLRRMRDAARAFSEGRWVAVPRFGTGDELEDLSIALDDLGKRLQQQLILRGANEALLTQTVRALPRPALLLGPDFEPLEVNGALREVGDLSPSNEGEALTALLKAPSLEAARREAEASGLPIELSLPLPGRPEQGHVPGTLVPLTRPVGPPFWLVLIGPDDPLDEERGAPTLLALLNRVDRAIDALKVAAPNATRELAELRVRTDEMAVTAVRPQSGGIVPAAIGDIVTRALADVTALYPSRPTVLLETTDPVITQVRVAESTGLVERAVRTLLRGVVASSPKDRPVELTIELQPTTVQLDVRGVAAELGDPGRMLAVFARAVGGSVGRPTDERSIVRLTLPRA